MPPPISLLSLSHPNKFDVGRHCVLRPLPLLHPTNANGGCPSESCPALRNPDGGGGGAAVWRSVNARRTTTNEPDVVRVPQPQPQSSSVAGGGGQGRRRHQSLGGARAATAVAAEVNSGSWAIDL